MTCRYCNQPVGVWGRLRGLEFCSLAHRDAYRREAGKLALARLLRDGMHPVPAAEAGSLRLLPETLAPLITAPLAAASVAAKPRLFVPRRTACQGRVAFPRSFHRASVLSPALARIRPPKLAVPAAGSPEDSSPSNALLLRPLPAALAGRGSRTPSRPEPRFAPVLRGSPIPPFLCRGAALVPLEAGLAGGAPLPAVGTVRPLRPLMRPCPAASHLVISRTALLPGCALAVPLWPAGPPHGRYRRAWPRPLTFPDFLPAPAFRSFLPPPFLALADGDPAACLPLPQQAAPRSAPFAGGSLRPLPFAPGPWQPVLAGRPGGFTSPSVEVDSVARLAGPMAQPGNAQLRIAPGSRLLAGGLTIPIPFHLPSPLLPVNAWLRPPASLCWAGQVQSPSVPSHSGDWATALPPLALSRIRAQRFAGAPARPGMPAAPPPPAAVLPGPGPLLGPATLPGARSAVCLPRANPRASGLAPAPRIPLWRPLPASGPWDRLALRVECVRPRPRDSAPGDGELCAAPQPVPAPAAQPVLPIPVSGPPVAMDAAFFSADIPSLCPLIDFPTAPWLAPEDYDPAADRAAGPLPAALAGLRAQGGF